MYSSFAFVRMGETEEGTEIARRALANVGAQMRKELSDAYRDLLEYGELQAAFEINDAIRDAFIAIANLSASRDRPASPFQSRIPAGLSRLATLPRTTASNAAPGFEDRQQESNG
jgi:hypothetical protein